MASTTSGATAVVAALSRYTFIAQGQERKMHLFELILQSAQEALQFGFESSPKADAASGDDAPRKRE